jgi:hypothetical protein
MTTHLPERSPSFFARIGLACGAFFRILSDAAFAGRVQHLPAGEVTGFPAPATAAQAAPRLHSAPAESALQLLGLLQREGRLLDFLMEDMSAYSDAEIGAAARVVHDQCHKALSAHVKLEPIRGEQEGARISVPAGFSASEIRLVGRVAGQAPFHGVLTHAGWRAREIELPKLSEGHDVRVLAQAEVEL